MDAEDIKAYIDNLRTEKNTLLNRVKEINAELYSFGIYSGADTKVKCQRCSGSGTYWDFWAGSMDCPECNGTGYVYNEEKY